MSSPVWIILVLSILHTIIGVVVADKNYPKFVIIGAGASGIASAARLIENGYNDIVILEAENRIGGRVHSTPFGKGYVDLGAQWCQGDKGNVVYELVKDNFEFGDNFVRYGNSLAYTSDGTLIDQNQYVKLMSLSESITYDYVNMAKFNKSLGEFFEIRYRDALQDKEFEDVDKEFAEQIADFSERGMNSLYASESWFDISSKLSSFSGEGESEAEEGNQQLTWKEHGFKTIFDFLTKKLPHPSNTLPVDDKIQFNKEVTNIDYTANQILVTCADGSEYRTDHVIVTVSLGFLKKYHRTLFTPPLPPKKINAIEHTGYGTLGKIFLEFKEPFWPTDVDKWAAYVLMWKKDDKERVIGTEKEWLTEITAFIREDAQPNLLGALVAGKHVNKFEEISDTQLIDDCMWLLEKFLGRTLPRAIDLRRSRWMSSKYFLGSYSYGSMDAQAHNVQMGKDLGETLYNNDSKPIVLIAGEATDPLSSGYVHGAVSSGRRVANEILDYYKAM